MQTLNTVWKRNRNQHARLLLAQLRAGVLQAPFDALPPPNGLPTMQPWTMYRCVRVCACLCVCVCMCVCMCVCVPVCIVHFT